MMSRRANWCAESVDDDGVRAGPLAVVPPRVLPFEIAALEYLRGCGEAEAGLG
jgi:hypothetical protein